MPLWIVYHPPGTFEEEATKQAFTQDVTKFYTNIGLPAFYVVINFVKLPAGDAWVGGVNTAQRSAPFIRIAIEHVALRIPSEEVARKSTDAIDAVIKPYIADKGYDSEYSIQQLDRSLWKINGMVPPPSNSEAEKMWVRENKASAWSN